MSGTRGQIVFWLCLLILLLPRQARGAWETPKHLQQARQAISLGETKKWEAALKRARESFRKEGEKMTFVQRNTNLMWLMLFWSKYHQSRAVLPSIKNASEFKSKKQLDDFIATFKKRMGHLERSLIFLRRYHSLYVRLAERSNARQNLYLQSSLSLERDMEVELRDRKIYLTFLDFVRSNWGDSQKVKQRLRKNSQLLSKIKEIQKRAEVQSKKIREEQIKFSRVLKFNETRYEQVQKSLQNQEKRATLFFWLGLAVAGAGALTAGAGGIVHLYAASVRSQILHVEFEYYANIGTGLLIAGASVFVLGISALVIGVVTNPGKVGKGKGVLKIQDEYLKSIRPTKEAGLWRGGHPSRSIAKHERSVPASHMTFGTW